MITIPCCTQNLKITLGGIEICSVELVKCINLIHIILGIRRKSKTRYSNMNNTIVF